MVAAFSAHRRLVRRLGNPPRGLSRILAETYGSMSIPVGERTFRLSARADRIEARADGNFAVLDYKTGAPPSGKQVRIGLSPQLTLTAAMLREGGFESSRPAPPFPNSLCTPQRQRSAGEERRLELTSNSATNRRPPDEAAREARKNWRT